MSDFKLPRLSELRQFAAPRPGSLFAKEWPLYHRATLNDGITGIFLFGDAVGINGCGMDDTNLQTPNQIPAVQYLVRAMALEIYGAARDVDLQTILRGGAAELVIGSTVSAVAAPLGSLMKAPEDLQRAPGPGFTISPCLIEARQNFGVRLTWSRPLQLMGPVSFHFYLLGVRYSLAG